MPRRTKTRCTSRSENKIWQKKTKQTRLAAHELCDQACCDVTNKLVSFRESRRNYHSTDPRHALKTSVFKEWSGSHCCSTDTQHALDNVKSKSDIIEKSKHLASNHDCGFPVFDVVSDEDGRLVLLPIDGPSAEGVRLEDVPPEATLAIRVFRFLEHRTDGDEIWEKELRNVNSGSLLWLPVHLAPGMHSTYGAKYGDWFTVHTVQVHAKNFKSAYHMCEGGCNVLAKSFGCSPAAKWIVKGQPLERGYYWFVSPASDETSTTDDQHFGSWGWKHVACEGPFSGARFVAEWQKRGSSLASCDLQAALQQVQGQP